MGTLLYTCPWAKCKEKSWSGTHWKLRGSLSKYYTIEDYDTGCAHNTSTPMLLYRGINRFARTLNIGNFIMEKARILLINKLAEKAMSDCDYPVLQFDSSPYYKGKKRFIYFDLHMGYVKKMHDVYPDLFTQSNYFGLSETTINYCEAQQRDFFRDVAGIFTMGKWLQKELIDNYGLPKEKVFHVGGGININAELIDDSKKKHNKILFVGRDFERKNGPLVVEAFKQLRKINENVELYIAGPTQLKIEGAGIYYIGDLSHDKLIEYFNLCDIFCMPSLFEAYGLVFAEALTFGLPCIGRDAFEMPYFIEEGKTGCLLKKQSVGELVELMQRLLKNEEVYRNVKNNRSFYIKEYSWDSVAARIAAVIDESCI